MQRTTIALSLALISCVVGASRAATITFDDLAFTGHVNDAGPTNNFDVADAQFNNFFNHDFGSWEGWALSDEHDTATQGFGNQYSAYDLAQNVQANKFAVAYTEPFDLPDTRITLPDGFDPVSADVTNTTYAALIMLLGDPNNFARQFTTGDYFELTISGLDANDQPVGTPVGFLLADYRDATPYVIDAWTQVDLTSLAGAKHLVFTLFSTDSGQFGINTPTYFALDNLVLAPVPEPSTLTLVLAASLTSLAVIRRRAAR